ncbi:MAG TPA: serine/threonine-protein kinase [Kofleriaceae bacterium]|nr:serine/threonine-protein kinase [Kofleriaceae bacterium]
MRALGSASVPLDSAEGRDFLQRRIALFARVIFFLDFGFFVLIRVLELVAGVLRPAVFLAPSELAHLASAAVAALMWRACAGRPRSAASLGRIEAGGLVLVAAFFALMGATMPLGESVPEMAAVHGGFGSFIMIIAFTNVAIARAVLVPSTPRRTLWVVLAATAPVVGAIAFIQIHWLQDALLYRLLHTVQFAAYLTLPVVVATVTSRVIYGLREQVREAAQLGQYTLEEKIGEGAMGAVYRARHAMLRRPTAIKLLPPDRAGERNIARFEREVQLTSKLTHPNTVAIYDYGRTPDGVFYYAMELLDGVDLEQLVGAAGPQPPGRVVHILAQVCGALSEAHAVGLIHRDIKPANILLCERGGASDVAKVVDFGLVKEREGAGDGAGDGDGAGAVGDGDARASQSAAAITGTPLYLSPEAIREPRAVDARSDLYALGAVGYFLLTGRPVFQAESVVELCGMHLYREPVPPAERVGRRLPDELCQLLLRCLAKRPDERPASAADLRAALLACPVAPWTDADSAPWWLEHGAALRAARAGAAPVEPYAATVAIDLRLRQAQATAIADL